MLYIFQYSIPAPHFICVVIPKCKSKEFSDNPNVILPIFGDVGVFQNLSNDTIARAIKERSGPVLPAIRHMEFGGRGWKKSHITKAKVKLSTVWACRPLTTLNVQDAGSSLTSYLELLQSGCFSSKGEVSLYPVPLENVIHLPLTNEVTGYFANYILYLYSLFLSMPNRYNSLAVGKELEQHMDLDSNIKDVDVLNIAICKYDYLKLLTPEQSASWYAPLNL